MTTQLSPLRSGRITGSRIGGVLGLKKGTKPDDVLREMVRQYFGDPDEFIGNALTEWGQDHEEPARAEYEQLTGNLVLDEQDFRVHPVHDFLGYSPDGVIGSDGLYEGKAPSDWAKWQCIDDKPEFYAQMQLGMEVFDLEWGHFFRWTPGGANEPEMVRRDRDWFAAQLPLLAEFHAHYLDVIADPKLAKPYRTDLVALLDDPESLLLEAELLQVQDVMDEMSGREKEIRAELTARAQALGSKTARGRWFQISRVAARGSVSYADAVKALAPEADLTPFTKPAGEPTYRISRVKEPE